VYDWWTSCILQAERAGGSRTSHTSRAVTVLVREIRVRSRRRSASLGDLTCLTKRNAFKPSPLPRPRSQSACWSSSSETITLPPRLATMSKMRSRNRSVTVSGPDLGGFASITQYVTSSTASFNILSARPADPPPSDIQSREEKRSAGGRVEQSLYRGWK